MKIKNYNQKIRAYRDIIKLYERIEHLIDYHSEETYNECHDLTLENHFKPLVEQLDTKLQDVKKEYELFIKIEIE